MKNFELIVFSGSSNKKLADSVSKNLKSRLGSIEIKHFADGETYVRLLDNVRGKDVYLLQSTCKPVNENLMELLIMADAAKRASAERLTAVIPYFGYARQDRKAASREPITAKLVAVLLEKAGFDRVLALDLHAGQIQGFFDIPLDNLTAIVLLIDFLKKRKLSDLVIVSPDAGAAKKCTKIARAFNAELAIINKARPKQNQAEAMNIIGEVFGKNCIMFDDIIDTAGTIVAGAKALKQAGAKSIIVCATHAVLSDPAIERIENSPIEEVIITDTIPLEKQSSKIKVLSVAELLSEAIKRSHNNKSLSSLFEYNL